ncbi:hypothetical protein [Streptomyces asiaticus]|uniref:hypothetical protein n=1 Tax=Streptomyces asiaticus TaxID=114695 RepID=UPI0038083DDC
MADTTPRVQTVAVDFDGVLHSYERGWSDGSIYGDWVPGAIGALSQLMQKYAVFIHTTRNARQVAKWIERQSGRAFECTTRVPRSGFWNEQGLLLVTARKLPAIAYIDDRAVRFMAWPEALVAVGIDPILTDETETS